MSVLLGGVYVPELVANSDLSGATVTCTVTAPDLSTTVKSSVDGAVTVSGNVASTAVTPTMEGEYLIVWQSTGAVLGAEQDQFSCRAARVDLISLPDLKDELNLRATDTSKDAKLRGWIDAANDLIENITGPIRPYPQTDYFDGGTESIVLMARWVTQVTAVLENWSGTDYTLTEQPVGASTTAYGYTWDKDTNTLVRRLTGGQPTVFFPGVRNVQVSYTGGLAKIPPSLSLAAAELIKHWYRKSQPIPNRGGGQFGQDGGDSDFMPSYMLPNGVMELIDPYRRPPGIF